MSAAATGLYALVVCWFLLRNISGGTSRREVDIVDFDSSCETGNVAPLASSLPTNGAPRWRYTEKADG